jgi:peptidyl-prolyl cis-trans isomerase C
VKRYRLPLATSFILPAAASLALLGCSKKEEAPAPAPDAAAAVTPPAEAPKAEEAKADATPKAPERLTGPVAKVNGVEIPSAAFYEEVDKITARGAQIPADRVARIEHNILKRMIEQELINQAIKEAQIVVPEAAVAAGFEEYKKRFQTEEQFENYLKHGRVTKESIETRIREREALEMLLKTKGNLDVTPEEAQAFYEKNERFYTDKAGIRASHILIKLAENATPEDEAKAMEKVKQAQARLKKGEAFDKVATELGEGPAASKGGDLGFFSEGRMVKEFEDVAFKMKVGTVSDPVKTRFGYHIIKLTDKREDRKKPFEEVKDQIVKSLENKKFFTERRKLVADLEKTAKIEKFLPEPPPMAPAAEGHLGGGHGPGDGHDHAMPPGVVAPAPAAPGAATAAPAPAAPAPAAPAPAPATP